MATLAKLEDSLEHVHSLSKTALGKELASVVRTSQGSSRASWKSAQRPNWWLENRQGTITENVEYEMPVFGPARTLTADGMKAALVSYYTSRIYFEQHVRGSATESAALEEDCNDGKNPYPPEHYQTAEENDVPAEEQEESEPEEAVADHQNVPSDDDNNNGGGDGGCDEDNNESDDSDDDSPPGTVTIEEDSSDFDVDALNAYADKLKSGEPEKMLEILRTKLMECMEQQASQDEWTAIHEQYKLRIAFHLCSAKMLCDIAMMKQNEEAELVTNLRTLRENLDPSDSSKSLRSRLQSRHNLADSEEEENDDEENEEIEAPAAATYTRRPRKAAVESGFITPINDSHRVKRANAASRALKNGTPSRVMKENETLYDANGNPVNVLFSAKGSPITVPESVAKPRRGRKARLPPPTPASSTAAGGTRRSKRNKR